MTQELKKRYSMKNVDMLLAAATIMDSAIENEVFLSAKRTTWANPFFKNTRVRIDQAISKYLGVDSAKDLRRSTQELLVLQSKALEDLAELKVQIEVDFSDNMTQQAELLNTLGYTSYNSAAKNGDQEALISLLYRFKENLTPEIRASFSAKGIQETALDGIIAQTENFKQADVIQEGEKGTRQQITAEAITEFNEIHKIVSGIARISYSFTRNDKALQEKFSFSKVAKTMNLQKKKNNNK